MSEHRRRIIIGRSRGVTAMPRPWTRFRRWLGLDRNPLRRPTDRIETALRLVVLVLLVAGVPVATVATGRAVDHWGLRQAQAERAEWHLVHAVLTEKAVADSPAHPYSDAPVVWVWAHWTAPDRSDHRGQVLAPVGARAGSSVPTWTDRSGSATDRPKTAAQIRVAVFVSVMAAAELLPVLLIALQFLALHLLNVRRWKAWDTEWAATGPRWSRDRA